MKYTAHLRGHGRVATHLIGLGLKESDAYRFQRHVDHLIKSRGSKGAILWLDSFGNLISERVFKIKLARNTWTSRKFYQIFRKAKNRELLRRLTKIKRVVVERQITAAQASKFLNAVQRTQPSEEGLRLASHYIRLGAPTLIQYSPRTPNWSAPSCLAAYVKRELVRGHEEEEANRRASKKLARDARVIHNLELNQLKPITDTFLPLSSYELAMLADSYGDEEIVSVGTVNCAQEPGGKARFSTAPLLALQEANRPLQDYLMDTLRHCPEDACFSESAAILASQDRMRKGEPVMVRDLTQATDNWPASLTWLSLELDRNIPPEHIALLRAISEGEFTCSDDMVASGFFEKKLRWTVGQPLGSRASFGAFSHSHHSLMRGIAISLRKSTRGIYFFKGDDYQCFDEECDAEYCRVMGLLGVPIPPEKSSVSSRHAEFAGQTILANESFYPGKWREVTEDSLWSFILDPAFDIDRVVPKLWARLIRRIKETPYPYGLYKPPLEGMDSHALSEFSRAVEELFLVQTLTTSRTDHQRPEWVTDHKLMANMMYTQEWATVLYPDLPLSHPFSKRQAASRKDFMARNIWNQPELDHLHQLSAWPNSLPRLYWEESSALTSLMTGFKYHRISRKQLSNMSFVTMSLRAHEQADLRASLNLIRSVIMSAGSSNRVPVWSWVDNVPLFTRIYGQALAPIDHLDLVHAVVSHFPHYEVTDFNQVGIELIRSLRKYSRPAEVMPQRTTPLPRLKRQG